MGIAAVLLLLSFQGIQILQRNSRDTERKNLGGEIDTMLNKYKRDNLRFPANTNVSFQQNRFTITGLSESLELDGFLGSSELSNSGSTHYLYNYISSSEYQLCVQLESGSYEEYGTIPCPTPPQQLTGESVKDLETGTGGRGPVSPV